MPEFTDCLTFRGRVAWAEICHELGWEIKTKPERKIEVVAKIEDIDEIDRIMRQQPGRADEQLL